MVSKRPSGFISRLVPSPERQDERDPVKPGGRIKNERRRTRETCVHNICMIEDDSRRTKGTIGLCS